MDVSFEEKFAWKEVELKLDLRYTTVQSSKTPGGEEMLTIPLRNEQRTILFARKVTGVSFCVFVFVYAVDLVSYTLTGRPFDESGAYTLSASLQGFDYTHAWKSVALTCFFLLASLFTCCACETFTCIRRQTVARLLWLNLLVVSLTTCSGASRYFLVSFYYESAAVSNIDTTSFFETHYVRAPTGQSLAMKNLFVIFAESLEQTFFDEETFPGLLPNLKRLSVNSFAVDNYTNILEEGGWTMGGLTAMLCGIRLITPIGGENFMDRVRGSFLPGARCLGDVLMDANYTLHYMGGAHKQFAGKDKLFASHGFQLVEGGEKRKSGEPTAPWGRFDDALLADAFERYDQLSKESNPFGIFIETVDTHGPGGVVSPACKNSGYYGDGRNGMLNSVHCSDKLIGEFLEKLRAHRAFENTVVVLVSDHLAHTNTADHLLKKSRAKRLNMFLVIRQESSRERNREIVRLGTSLDVGATILDYLGDGSMEGRTIPALGLGRSLRRISRVPVSLLELEGDEVAFSRRMNSFKKFFKAFWKFENTFANGFSMSDAMTLRMGESEFRLPVGFELEGKDGVIVDTYMATGIEELWKKANNATSTVFAALVLTPCREVHELVHLGGNVPCFQYKERNQTCVSGRVPLSGEKRLLLRDILSSRE